MKGNTRGRRTRKGEGRIRSFGCLLLALAVGVLSLSGVPGCLAGEKEPEGGKSFVGTVEGTAPEVRLLRGLVTALKPESLDLTLDGSPDESGRVRRLFFEARGVRQGGVRIDRLRVEALFVQLQEEKDAPSNPGGAPEPGNLGVKSAVQGYFEGRVTEKDLNDFLLGATLSSGNSQWKDLHLDLRPGGFTASARFSTGAVSALVEIRSRLEIQERDRLRMEDYQVSVNNADTDMALVKEALEKAQPLLDFRDFPFPVRLRHLDLDEQSLVLATQTPPSLFPGKTLTYRAR